MWWMAICSLVVGLLALPGGAEARQQNTVTGTVTDAQTQQPLPGVTVRVGTAAGTVTNAQGRYSLQAAANAVLSFSRVGYESTDVNIGGRTTVDVQLRETAVRLDELVVTGYQTQRRGDITAAVASVDVEAMEQQTSSSVLQRLAGRVPGVTVEASGSPGSRSTVRIRGVSSFQNNNPLYIIDGTPVEESFANFLNPHDVESIQVLKDASAASIYGARATNGVVIITTKKGRRGGAPQVSVDVNYGITNAVRGYDDFLIQDPLEYFQVIKRSYDNAGQPVPSTFTAIYGDPNNPTVPAYTYVHPSAIVARDQWGRPTQVNSDLYAFPNSLIMPGSQGTNWWDAVFGTGEVRDVNLAVRGGSATARYSVGINYFDQFGTAAYNRYQRGTARVNTDFTVGRLTLGENLTVALEESYGGLGGDNLGEGGIVGKNILSLPVVPLYDINGNFASGKSPGLGNNTNPLKAAYAARDNRNTTNRIFGNVYGRLGLSDALSFNTSLGINSGVNGTRGFNEITPENSEPNFNNSIFENSNTFWNWTWNNTLNYVTEFGNHNVNVVAGQEAIRGRNRFISASMGRLVSPDIDSRYIQAALGDPSTRDVSSSGGYSSLLSFFGKADYNYNQRYYLSATVRRDGSSRLGLANRWGTFPAFSAGWRASQESFLADNAIITNLMLRAGWGITGNQNIAAGRIVDFYGGSTGTSFYDIAGADSRIVTGYRQTAIGNPGLRWEENQSTNFGMDLELFGGSTTLVLDVYERNSDNLLFNPPLPGTAGLADAPIVNVGQMRNRGIDGTLSFRGTLPNDIGWNLDLNASHYRNKIVRIDGEREEFFGPIGTRFSSSVTVNRLGEPIGAFYGYRKLGFFQSQAEIDALNAQARAATGSASAVYQVGAKPGRFRWEDTNGDGRVTSLDRTIIGTPHPDLTGGVNLGLNWGGIDVSADLFGSLGNEIYDVQKEFYVFRLFNTNVRRDLLADSWTPDNPDAKYPQLDVTDDFSRDPSSFYVEDASYLRLRSLQIGYTIPTSGRFRALENARIYVRGENLFTITGYDGLDPSLPAIDASRAGMDIRDQARGVDRGTYPTNRTLNVGFSVGF